MTIYSPYVYILTWPSLWDCGVDVEWANYGTEGKYFIIVSGLKKKKKKEKKMKNIEIGKICTLSSIFYKRIKIQSKTIL
jgi:hypothetical protein